MGRRSDGRDGARRKEWLRRWTLGVALGRWLWTLFAREVYAVPRPTVPVGEILWVCAGTMVLVNIVAALPGRSAARTRTARVLHAE